MISRSLLYKLGILLILILLVATYEYFDNDSIQITTSKKAATVDYFANDVDVIQYKTDGAVDYKLNTKQLIHTKEQDISYLKEPIATIYKNNPNPWHIKSDKGDVTANGEKVTLYNNIRGTQIDEKGKENIFTIGKQKTADDPIKYGQVIIYPDKKNAESNDYATITSPDGTTSGDGIQADFETNKIHILSNVKTLINRGKNAY